MKTPRYNIGIFRAGILYSNTLNQVSLRDSFHAAEAVKSIPNCLFSQGYNFSPSMSSLFLLYTFLLYALLTF